MTLLLPCPFCGGPAEIVRHGTSAWSTIYQCSDCGCKLETGETRNFGLRWNQRSDKNGVSPEIQTRVELMNRIMETLVREFAQPRVDLTVFRAALSAWEQMK